MEIEYVDVKGYPTETEENIGNLIINLKGNLTSLKETPHYFLQFEEDTDTNYTFIVAEGIQKGSEAKVNWLIQGTRNGDEQEYRLITSDVLEKFPPIKRLISQNESLYYDGGNPDGVILTDETTYYVVRPNGEIDVHHVDPRGN